MEPMKTEQIVVRCSKDLKERVKNVANSENMSVSDYIRHICSNWVRDNTKSQ
jgi:predicted DNA binding CopG/RHH family protein